MEVFVPDASQSRSGLLSRLFNALDDSNKRQFKAGLAAMFTGYALAGLASVADAGATGAFVRDLLFTDFGWQNLAFHVIFAAATNAIGAAGIATYDHSRKKSEVSPGGPAV